MSNLIRKFLDLFYPIVSKIFDKTFMNFLTFYDILGFLLTSIGVYIATRDNK